MPQVAPPHDPDDADATPTEGFEGLGQKHWKSDRVKQLEREGRHTPRPGFIEVYTGDGKGKTTASLGLVMRAAGYGHRSCIVSFMKGDPNYGELRLIKQRLDDMVDWHLAGRPNFVDPSNPAPEDIAAAQEGWEIARAAIRGGDYMVVVLDEINVVLALGLIDTADVLEALDSRPAHVEVVLTGRDAPQEIIERADLVSEVRMVKHFYEADIPARRGIEF